MSTTATPAESDRAFPHRSVIILALVLTINGYTLASLFPYVGMMVKHIMGLSTINEAGENRLDEGFRRKKDVCTAAVCDVITFVRFSSPCRYCHMYCTQQ